MNNVNYLQHNLNKIVLWTLRNKLKLNIAKCRIVSYTRKKHSVPSSYKINDVPLSKETIIKDLGVLFDSNMTFVNHIESIASAASKTLGFIMRTAKLFHSPLVLKSLYFSFVLSKLQFASNIWSPYYICHQLNR